MAEDESDYTEDIEDEDRTVELTDGELEDSEMEYEEVDTIMMKLASIIEGYDTEE